MPTAHLHAGLFKTGTTAIQAGLLSERAHLAASGLHVARTGQSAETGAHHALVQALAGLQLGPKQADLPERLRAEIDAAGRPDLLVSSEFLSLILRPRGALERVAGWEAAWRPMARRLRGRAPADRPRSMADRMHRAGYDVAEIGFDPGADEVI